MKSLRATQQALTRQRILDGAEQLLRAGETPTFAAVAKRCEVTERTVYRHFPTGDALAEAAWRNILVQFANDRHPHTAQEFQAHVREAFRRFDGDARLVRELLHTRHVAALRRVDDGARRAALEQCVEDAVPGLTRGDRKKAAAALRVLYSAPCWELLRDLYGHSGEEAAGVVAFAATHLFAGLRARTPPKPRRGAR